MSRFFAPHLQQRPAAINLQARREYGLSQEATDTFDVIKRRGGADKAVPVAALQRPGVGLADVDLLVGELVHFGLVRRVSTERRGGLMGRIQGVQAADDFEPGGAAVVIVEEHRDTVVVSGGWQRWGGM